MQSSKLEQIEAQLRSLYEKGEFLRFVQQGEDDGAATRLLEDLREAISDYQASFCLQHCSGPFIQLVQMTQQIAIYAQSSRLIVSQLCSKTFTPLRTLFRMQVSLVPRLESMGSFQA